MTLVTLPSPILFPGIAGAFTGGPTFATNSTLSSAGHYSSLVVVAKEDMVISHVSFRAGTSTGSPTVIASIEGVDGSGIPDGAATYGGSASAATGISSNTNPVIALGGSATVPRGSVFAIKIAFSTGTSQVVQGVGSYSTPSAAALPYNVINTGSPTKSIANGMGLFGVGSSATTFYNVIGTMPASSFNAGNFNNTNSAKRGLKFTPTFNCRIIGFRFYASTFGGNYNAGVYDSSGAGVDGSVTAFDGDQNALSSSGLTVVYFDTAVTASAGSTYYVAVEPTSATNVNLSFFSFPTDLISGSPGNSMVVYSVFATSSWTDTATNLPIMDILIDQIDNGAGSGGGGQRVFGG
jgi:hypothetical protein